MTERQSGPRGQIVTVVAARAGCGKTTLATNLAAALATGRRRVCVVDLDLTAGDVAVLLGVQPTRSVTDATGLAGKLAIGGVLALITPIRRQFDGILATSAPWHTLSAEVTTELFAGLRKVYDHIVVDTPSLYGPHVLAALDVADHHVVVGTPERPALRDLRLVLDTLDLLSCPAACRSVVLNQTTPCLDLTTEAIETSVNCSVAAELPSTVDIPVSVNRGVPLTITQPSHEYSRAVFRFVQEHLTLDQCAYRSFDW
jgi:pilus assembly protein CpaE